MFRNYETEKITRKACRKPAIITCCSVVPPEIVMHDAYIGGRSESNTWRAGCSQLEYVDIHSVY